MGFLAHGIASPLEREKRGRILIPRVHIAFPRAQQVVIWPGASPYSSSPRAPQHLMHLTNNYILRAAKSGSDVCVCVYNNNIY